MTKTIRTAKDLILAIEENNKTGNLKLEFELNSTISYNDNVLEIKKPIVIEGNGSTIVGNGGNMFFVTSCDVKIQNLTMKNFVENIYIDAKGKCIQNIAIHNCVFKEIGRYAINAVSTESNSKMSNISITDNTFVGDVKNITEGGNEGFKMFITMAAGKARENDIENVELSDVVISNNKMSGGHRASINLVGSTLDSLGMDFSLAKKVINPTVKNVKISNNIINGAWDVAVNIVGGFLQQENAIISDVQVLNNEIVFGVWGVVVVCCEPLGGYAKSGKVEDVIIKANKLTADPNACGEIQYAIACFGARTDYFPNVHCENIGIENIMIEKNTIEHTDRAFIVSGSDVFLDGQNTSIKNCYVKNINIKDNTLIDVIDAFIFAGGYAEGRMFDYKIGVPPHNQIWGALAKNEDETYVCENNYIENITCMNNTVKGNRYKYKIYGALARGHGGIKGNKIINAKINNNTFEDTEGHIHFADFMADGWCKDLGGNTVDKKLKNYL